MKPQPTLSPQKHIQVCGLLGVDTTIEEQYRSTIMDSGEQYVMTVLIKMTVTSYVECLDLIFHEKRSLVHILERAADQYG